MFCIFNSHGIIGEAQFYLEALSLPSLCLTILFLYCIG